ncbi:VgrG protein [Pseudomonas synxantha]|uniref:VgrG protein n=2 Tax=Pseudomonas TaxID=286 RepID=A0A3G7U5H2_9PSED|nr:VgrG protein [Pseudomonas synxantha]
MGGGDATEPALTRFHSTEQVRTARQVQRDYTFTHPRYNQQHTATGDQIGAVRGSQVGQDETITVSRTRITCENFNITRFSQAPHRTRSAVAPLIACFPPPLKDRSYTFAKHFRRPHLKYSAVTKNDEPFSTINVMYSVVLGKKPTRPFIS